MVARELTPLTAVSAFSHFDFVFLAQALIIFEARLTAAQKNHLSSGASGERGGWAQAQTMTEPRPSRNRPSRPFAGTDARASLGWSSALVATKGDLKKWAALRNRRPPAIHSECGTYKFTIDRRSDP